MILSQWIALATAVAAQSTLSAQPLAPNATVQTTTTSASAATSTTTTTPPSNASTSNDADMDLIASRRRADLAASATTARIANIPLWLASQGENGTWSDVDYRMGCEAQRANWPIQEHWNRIITLAAAWSGLNPWSSNYTADPEVLAAALRGMDWWFANDYTNSACVGGTPNAACPCGTPGLWNTNWYGQVILIPQLASTACVLVQPANLTATQTAGCIRIPLRAYELRDSDIPGFGPLTGANTVNVMQNSVSLAVFTRNASMLRDALDRAMGECVFTDTPTADGIHRDGSFLQHNGILYTGNYGKDLLNAFISLESAATGTQFAAGNATREAIAAMVSGAEWMMFRDRSNGTLKWDYNTIGRFIAFPTADLQASADININATLLARAVRPFSGSADVSAVLARLEANLTSPLLGNRGFWAADYMVHRTKGTTFANKMISTRSTNNEWANSANPWGYYTGQGTLFTYTTGQEYLDIEAAWDWRLIPGTTVPPVAAQRALNASRVGINGTRELVGVVSDSRVGMSAMQYAVDGLAFNKAWFFLADAVLVTTSAVNASAISVLDNRAAAPGGIFLDGKHSPASSTHAQATTLRYGGTGYISHGTPFNLTLSESSRAGNWSAIGTSRLGMQSARVFTAYTSIPAGVYSYTVLASTTGRKLQSEARHPSVSPLDAGDGVLGAITKDTLALAFFVPNRTRVCEWDLEVGVSHSLLLLLTKSDHGRGHRPERGGGSETDDPSRSRKGLTLTLSDPTQRLQSVQLTLHGKNIQCPTGAGECTQTVSGVVLNVTLPSGGWAGSSVSVALPRR